MNATPGSKGSTDVLSVFMCLYIDVPQSGKECSAVKNGTNNCIRCPIKGAYITGERIDDYTSSGHVVCLILWTITVAVALFGIVANSLIITVFRRRNSGRAFDLLLTILASFDLFCCMIVIVAATAPVSYFGNWFGRTGPEMYWFYISCVTVLFGRSTSIFTTVLITIERYFVVSYPIHARSWFTSGKSKFLAVLGFLIAVLIAIPRYSSAYVDHNIYSGDEYEISSLHRLQYIIRSTRLHKLWYHTLHSAHNQFDHWVPLPLLFIFNFLSYRKVQQMTHQRKELNPSQASEIQAINMFLPVVLVLFFCNIGPTVNYMIMHFGKILFREMYMLVLLSIALNSSVNLPIYYMRGSAFRADAQVLIAELYRGIFSRAKGNGVDESVTEASA